MASSLSYPFLHFSSSPVKKKLFFIFHVLCLLIRYSSLTLPSTSSPATIAISLDKSEKLLVRRRRIVGSKLSMVNQRLPSSKEPGFLILAPLYLSFCSIEHNYISFSWTSWDHKEFKLRLHQFLKKSRISTTVLLGPVFLGNKGLNDVENDELPRLVYVLVRREPN
ncbi:hypothetical protein HID58_085268 [Brassica napus]|uniref:Uncharacterized protein n=1 Tax=Brassica napus TaxID=3708 RepID=A0ABQ7XP51_BRANA|nr:hypothetical protein HID58_085268 [Brassica napus]